MQPWQRAWLAEQELEWDGIAEPESLGRAGLKMLHPNSQRRRRVQPLNAVVLQLPSAIELVLQLAPAGTETYGASMQVVGHLLIELEAFDG
jgi:hypothetical protein